MIRWKLIKDDVEHLTAITVNQGNQEYPPYFYHVLLQFDNQDGIDYEGLSKDGVDLLINMINVWSGPR